MSSTVSEMNKTKTGCNIYSCGSKYCALRIVIMISVMSILHIATLSLRQHATLHFRSILGANSRTIYGTP